MSNDQNNLPVKRDDFTLAKPGSLLDEALSKLPKEQQERMLAKAIEKRIDIDAEAKIADLRYQASSVDMANTIRQVHALEQSTKSDYTVRADCQTASGKTIVEVKKSNNTVIIVIAIVIGVILLLFFAN
ncbi:MAG: hypothetical protein ACOX7Q_17355 [Kiritimatiellia bacterium]|jgi:hypothetical protein